MTTCMVARKRDGCSVRRNSFAAFLFPSCAIFSSLASLQETTAISAQANTALTAINTTCKRILPTMSNVSNLLNIIYAFFKNAT